MNVIAGLVLGLCGLLFIYLFFIRKWSKTKLGILALCILILPSLASGLPLLYIGVKTVIKKEAAYQDEWHSGTYRGVSAVAVGVVATLMGLALAGCWIYALTH